MKKIIKSENAPKAIGPYNQGIMTDNLLFLSGQIPLDAKGNIVSDKIEEQTKQCLANIDILLNEAGLTKNNIVKSTILLKDMNDFMKVNEVYASFFENSIFPARSTFAVAGLPKDAKVEIEVIAAKS